MIESEVNSALVEIAIQNEPSTGGIFDKYTADAEASDTFVIRLSDGTPINFKHPRGRKELRAWRRHSKEFAESMTPVKVPPAWKPYFPENDRETVFWCHFMSLACPDAGILDWLKLQHYKPVLFDVLMTDAQKIYAGISDADEAEAIEDTKKE